MLYWGTCASSQYLMVLRFLSQNKTTKIYYYAVAITPRGKWTHVPAPLGGGRILGSIRILLSRFSGMKIGHNGPYVSDRRADSFLDAMFHHWFINA